MIFILQVAEKITSLADRIRILPYYCRIFDGTPMRYSCTYELQLHLRGTAHLGGTSTPTMYSTPTVRGTSPGTTTPITLRDTSTPSRYVYSYKVPLNLRLYSNTFLELLTYTTSDVMKISCHHRARDVPPSRYNWFLELPIVGSGSGAASKEKIGSRP
jgi:hypothetical protein